MHAPRHCSADVVSHAGSNFVLPTADEPMNANMGPGEGFHSILLSIKQASPFDLREPNPLFSSNADGTYHDPAQ